MVVYNKRGFNLLYLNATDPICTLSQETGFYRNDSPGYAV